MQQISQQSGDGYSHLFLRSVNAFINTGSNAAENKAAVSYDPT